MRCFLCVRADRFLERPPLVRFEGVWFDPKFNRLRAGGARTGVDGAEMFIFSITCGDVAEMAERDDENGDEPFEDGVPNSKCSGAMGEKGTGVPKFNA